MRETGGELLWKRKLLKFMYVTVKLQYLQLNSYKCVCLAGNGLRSIEEKCLQFGDNQ